MQHIPQKEPGVAQGNEVKILILKDLYGFSHLLNS